jgi:alkanesulfonate monooxygenase SsuD/methylene tetrahydromethanopterin reductase-like flavin-dependent oxidoreductase (luciferase family)
MAEHRASAVGRDGHCLGCQVFVAADDESAIQRAEQLIEAHDVKLWSGTRFIARLAHSAK